MQQKAQRIALRVSEAEKKAWSAAAGGDRQLSNWLRSLANIAATQAERASQADTNTYGDVKVSIGKTNGIELPREKIERAKEAHGDVKKLVPRCARWMHHRPGTYCSSCGRTP